LAKTLSSLLVAKRSAPPRRRVRSGAGLALAGRPQLSKHPNAEKRKPSATRPPSSKEAPDILWGLGRCLGRIGALPERLGGTVRRWHISSGLLRQSQRCGRGTIDGSNTK
jgi:hypothetical protein